MSIQSSSGMLERHLGDILVWLWAQDTQDDMDVAPVEIHLALVRARKMVWISDLVLYLNKLTYHVITLLASTVDMEPGYRYYRHFEPHAQHDSCTGSLGRSCHCLLSCVENTEG